MVIWGATIEECQEIVQLLKPTELPNRFNKTNLKFVNEIPFQQNIIFQIFARRVQRPKHCKTSKDPQFLPFTVMHAAQHQSYVWVTNFQVGMIGSNLQFFIFEIP